MSYQISQNSDLVSQYRSGDVLSSASRSGAGEGSDFLQSLGSLFEDTKNNTGTYLKSSDNKTVLALNTEASASKEEFSTRLSNRIRDFKMLDNQAPSMQEWNKAFSGQSDSDGWSMLETLGSGLLTAAKIVGAAALF